MKSKIFIASPSKYGLGNPYSINSLMWNMYELGREGIEVTPPAMYDEYPLSRARNVMCEDLRESDCTHIFMYDDDQAFPAGTLIRLIRSAEESEQPVVCGFYLARVGNDNLIVFKRDTKPYRDPNNFAKYSPLTIREMMAHPTIKTEHGTLKQVEGIGLGCALIHRDVFETLQYPWFLEWSNAFVEKTEDGEVNRFGEDLWFCDLLGQHKIPIYVNMKCFIGHWAKQGFLIGVRHYQRKLMQEGIIGVEDVS